VHDRLKAKLDKTHKTAYAEIDKHSKEMAGHIMRHLRDNGHLGAGDSISNVFWTSNPDKENKAGDHEKTTGVKDVNSNGDVIVRIRDKRGNIKHVAISAKYGNNKPNYRNPGMDSMEKMAGLKSGSLSKHMDDHKAFIDSENYYTGSADNRNYQTKVDHLAGSKGIEAVRAEYAKHEATLISGKKLDAKDALMHANAKAFVEKHDSLPKKEQTAMIGRARARAAAAQESNQNARRNIATDLHAGFSQQSPEQLTELIRGVVSPKTHIPHIVAHSQTSEDGTAKHHVTAAENLASDHFAKFDMSTLTPHKGSGTSVVFKAKHKCEEFFWTTQG
jgi:hypothetical protein